MTQLFKMPTTILILLDEVNCKFTNLDVVTRRKMTDAVKFYLPYARHLPAVRLGRWDGSVSYCDVAGRTYINLLDKLLPIVQQQGYDIEIDDRRAVHSFEFEQIDNNSYSHVLWPKGHPLAGQPIVVKDHQVEVVNAYLKNLTGINIAPTGSGKCLDAGTLLPVSVDIDTPFGDYFYRECTEYSVMGGVSIGKLAKLVQDYTRHALVDNQEYPVHNLGISIDTPSGVQPVHYIIQKPALDMVTITFSNGYTLRCAAKHLVRRAGCDVYAKDVSTGDVLEHRDGGLTVMSVHAAGVDRCFDINVPTPHLYYDLAGLVHHNTIITAILSHKVEPYGRSIVIVPTKDLVTQTEEDYINFGLDVGVFYGDRKDYEKTHTICTWQSLESLAKRTRAGQQLDIDINEFFKDVVCVIADECFAPNALVLTETGYVPIKDIAVGDVVVNYSETAGKYKKDRVTEVHRNLTKSSHELMYALEFNNREVIEVTGNHRFLTARGWIRADELTVEDNISSMRLVKRTEIKKPEVVYTLGIENDHNYIVQGAVVENCHRAKGDVLRKILSGPLANAPIRWGLTGTMPELEFEQVGVVSCIGPVLNKIETTHLQEQGILAKLHVNVWQLQDLGAGAFSSYQNELKWLTTSPPRLEFLASKFNELSETGNTLILVDRIETGNTLQSLIPGSIFISGKMKSDERKAEYKEVQQVNGKVIIATYGVASTGININRIFNLVLFEAGKSFVRVIQSIGRGIRVAEDKDFVNIYDVCSISKYSKQHSTRRKKFYNEYKYPYTVTKLNY